MVQVCRGDAGQRAKTLARRRLSLRINVGGIAAVLTSSAESISFRELEAPSAAGLLAQQLEEDAEMEAELAKMEAELAAEEAAAAVAGASADV